MGRTPSPIPLSDIAAIGPYFAFTAVEASEPAEAAEAEAPGWLTVRALIDDRHGLGLMIDDVAARLGTRQRWIAASIFYQGWAARLTSIYAASASLCGAVPDLRADRVSFRLRHPGPVELNVAPLRSMSPAAGWRLTREDHLGPLATAIRGEVRIGAYLLRGNVGSALAGALGIIATQHQRPLDSLLRLNWTHPLDLARSGRWLRTPDGPRYARATCCGYEQLGPGRRCGDCSLNWHGQRWPLIAAPSDHAAEEPVL
jgi:hypothetical protein